MSRRQTHLGLLTVLSLLIGACSSGTASAPPTTSDVGSNAPSVAVTAAPTAAEPVELKIWSHWGEPGKQAWIESVIADYTAANPNVTISVEWYGDKADLYTQLNAVSQAGGANAPDIHTVDFRPLGHIPQQENGWLLNLKDGLDTSHWDPGLLGAATFDDGIWGVPIESFGIFLWYDKSLFAKWGVTVPEDGRITLEQFDQIAALAKQEGMFTVAQGVLNLTAFSAHYPVGMLLNDLGPDRIYDIVAEAKEPFNTPDLVAALQRIVDTLPTTFNPDVATLNQREGAQIFFARKAAFTVEGSWLPGWFRDAKTQGGIADDFDLGVLRFPTLPEGKGDGVVQWGAGSGWGASVFTKHPDEVIDFLNFASSAEYGTRWVEMTDVPTGMSAPIPPEASELVRQQLAWQKEGPSISPAIYQIPAGDLEVFWKEGLTRFFADPGYSAQEFLDGLQKIRERG